MPAVRSVALAAFVFLAALAPGRAAAENASLPVPLQAALVKRILAYDRTLDGRADMRVLVVAGGDADAAEQIVSAFAGMAVNAQVVKASQLASSLVPGTVVLVLPGGLTAAVEESCLRAKALSLAPVSSWAEDGKVSVGIGTRDNKPEIVINLKRSKAEAHDFSTQLLKLARVIP